MLTFLAILFMVGQFLTGQKISERNEDRQVRKTTESVIRALKESFKE